MEHDNTVWSLSVERAFEARGEVHFRAVVLADGAYAGEIILRERALDAFAERLGLERADQSFIAPSYRPRVHLAYDGDGRALGLRDGVWHAPGMKAPGTNVYDLPGAP